uniref:snRNA-activating protein complex subunit 3 n=1 Tax=Magallana gigas TaxID=29159 RepID=K1PHX7_MAGGI
MEKLGVHRDASQLISVREFLTSWDASVIPGMEMISTKSDAAMLKALSKEMGTPIDTLQELSTVCGVQRDELERRQKNPTYKTFIKKAMRMKKCDYLMNFPPDAAQVKEECPKEFCVQHPDVIITAHVHQPNNTHLSFNMKIGLDQTLLVLGCERLTDLRDKITCVNDLALAGDLSENPDFTPEHYAKDIYKSGFFYIEGCFYNDFRDGGSQDYSQVIRDWAKEPGRGIGPMQSVAMEDTSFLDLNIRLGQPYIYLHQGDSCTYHMVLSHQDPQDIRDYPLVTHKHLKNQTKCRVCQMHASRWMAYDSEHSPENPSFFCEQCFRALHYDEHGNKIGNFQAFRYFDKSAVI